MPLSKEILDAIDLDAAQGAVKKIESQIDTMSYAPPEGMAEQLRMVAGHMNELAMALCLQGPPEEAPISATIAARRGGNPSCPYCLQGAPCAKHRGTD